jgi:hypothetical protein
MHASHSNNHLQYTKFISRDKLSFPYTVMSVFSLEGKGIKFNDTADIEPYLDDIKDDVTKIHLSGNTFGVNASIALSKRLENKQNLKVFFRIADIDLIEGCADG